MPSPVGHALAGTAIHLSTAGSLGEARQRWRLALLVVVAGAADLDLVLRLVDGRTYHNGWTHSVGAALLATLAAFAVARIARLRGSGRLALAVGAVWGSHVVLDYLNRDTNPPIGVMALWPFDEGFYNVQWPVLLDISRELTWQSMRHNLLAAAWEVVVLLPLVLLAARRWGGWRKLV